MSRSTSNPGGRREKGDYGRRGQPSGRRTAPETDNPYEGERWQHSTPCERDDGSGHDQRR